MYVCIVRVHAFIPTCARCNNPSLSSLDYIEANCGFQALAIFLDDLTRHFENLGNISGEIYRYFLKTSSGSRPSLSLKRP